MDTAEKIILGSRFDLDLYYEKVVTDHNLPRRFSQHILSADIPELGRVSIVVTVHTMGEISYYLSSDWDSIYMGDMGLRERGYWLWLDELVLEVLDEAEVIVLSEGTPEIF